MLIRALLVAATIACWHGALHAASDCAPAAEQRKSAEPIVDWYDNYIRPYRMMPAGAGAAALTKTQVEEFIDKLGLFNRRAVLDSLIFESLVQQIMESYARAPNFKGIDTAAVEKIYKSGIGEKLDFSLLCITAKSMRLPDDAFGITLFGVIVDDCQHIGLRGLVYTGALVNGSANGQCRPDLNFRKNFFVPVLAGTNEITYICGKDRGGCARQ